MKKRLSVFLSLLLVFSFVFSGSAFADDISVSVSGGGSGVVGSSTITLHGSVTSASTDLEYMWYSSPVDNLFNITSLGVSSLDYTPPQNVGTMYYCLGVRSSSGGMWTYSNLAAVTYNNGTRGVNIISRPNKWQYYVGETIDLTGLAVEITNASGTWTAYNGADVTVTPRVLTAQGEVVITVSFDNFSDSFGVTVSPHTHSYSAWTVTKAATCTATGTRTRTCSCGDVQTETIARTAHSWNNGTVANGVRTYTCKVCGTTRTETVTVSPSPSATPRPSASPNTTATPFPTITPSGTVGSVVGTTGGTTGGTSGGTVGGTVGGTTGGATGSTGVGDMPVGNGAAGSAGTVIGSDQQDNGGFKWWIIPLVAAAVGVVAGGGAYMYLTFVKKE